VARTSIAARYAALEDRRAAIVPAGQQPTALHLQTVRVLGELLEMAQLFSSSSVPAPLRAMMRMLHKLEPELVKELATVPAEEIRQFLRTLAEKIMTIVDVEEPGATAPGPTSPTGADQSQTA
jgi:hypothetical protein